MPPPPPSLADRFALILRDLGRVVAARMTGGAAGRPGLMLLWCYLQRRILQFTRLVERVRLGTLPPPRPAGPHPAPRPGGPRLRLPGGFAWLLPLVPEASAYGSQLHALLTEPEMAALLAAAPQAGRILRPLCHMLGQQPAPALLPPPRPTVPTRPPRVRTPPADTAGASPPAPGRSARWRTLWLGSFRLRVPA